MSVMKIVLSNLSGRVIFNFKKIVIFKKDTKDLTDADQKAFLDRSGDKKHFLLRMKIVEWRL